MPPPASLDAPPEAGWPLPGQEVRWQAHVMNYGVHTLGSARYTWQIDGNTVASGEIRLAQGELLSTGETVIELARPWSFTREEIGFAIEVDTAAGIAFSDEITVLSNGLTVGLWIEQVIYDWMASEPEAPPFELWARQQIDRWNSILAQETEPLTVDYQVIDRLRLDRIVVLPTGSVHPWGRVLVDTDIWWYFPQDSRINNSLRVGEFEGVRNPNVILHELLHGRGVQDVYAYEVLHGNPNGSEVQILEPDGSKAAGSARMPVQAGRVYDPPFDNFVLMGSNYSNRTLLSAHSAYGLNLVSGRRTPRFLDQFGSFLNGFAEFGGNPYVTHVPEWIEVALTQDAGGNQPLRDVVAVDVFLDHGDGVYDDVYLPEPDFTLDVDSSGIVVLSGELWQDTTWEKRIWPNVVILRARTEGDAQ